MSVLKRGNSGESATGSNGVLHLTHRELIEYREGQMEDFERERVEDHIEHCQLCHEECLAVEAFLDPGGQEVPLSDQEIQKGWHDLRPRLAMGLPSRQRQEIGKRGLVSRVLSWFGWLWRRPALTLATLGCVVAIGFAVVTFTLSQDLRSLSAAYRTASSQWTLERERAERERRQLRQELTTSSERYLAQIEAAHAPKPNVPVLEVFPRDLQLRGADQREPSVVPQSTSNFLLILNAQEFPDHPAYGMAILDRQGRVVWRGSGLKRNEFGNFTVVLGQPFLAPGTYRVILYSELGHQSTPIGEYVFSIGSSPGKKH